MTEQTTNPVITWLDAPASWNTYYLTPDGFKCQLTLRDSNGAELLKKASAAMKYLIEHDCTPFGQPNDHNGKAAEPETKVCEFHNAEMKKHEKDGQVWYSHKLADGSYCKGKSK